MTTPERIALKQAGDTITLLVATCAKVPVGQYPEYEFVGTDANRRLCSVAVPQSSVSRQLARLELTVEGVVGKTLTFSRDPNASAPSKPYWGITLASEQMAPAAAPTPAPAAVSTPPDGEQNGAAMYAKITDYVLTKVVPKYTAMGIPVTMEGTAAIVATLYISKTRNH